MNKLIFEMMEHERDNPKHIQHFLKVNYFAKIIAEEEQLDERTKYILDVATITHDIGINKAHEVYGSGAGKYQEELGPAIALELLTRLGYDKELIDRVCFLIGHHHTYTNIDAIDYQILVEADFLVNLYENNSTKEACRNVKEKIFKTKTGLKIISTMFDI